MKINTHLNHIISILGFLVLIIALEPPVCAEEKSQITFKRIPIRYIVALDDPNATSGSRAELWGLWKLDPGPRGVMFTHYEILKATGGVTPSGWKFDQKDWWLDEHGLIMEKPKFPLAPGKYLVTGDREIATTLTIYPKNDAGTQRWELANGAKLYDVTHLPCRSARYTPITNDNTCSPAKAPRKAFKVAPGAIMPPIEGCNKQDYAVLFVIGIAVEK